MGAPEEISVPQESVVGSVLREILYLLLKIVAIAAAFIVVFTFVFGVLRYSENAMLPGGEGWRLGLLLPPGEGIYRIGSGSAQISGA